MLVLQSIVNQLGILAIQFTQSPIEDFRTPSYLLLRWLETVSSTVQNVDFDRSL